MERHVFDLSAGDLALSFANSVDGSRSRVVQHGHPQNEHIRSYEDVLEWAVQAGALDEGARRRLLRAAQARPAEAAKVHRRAIELREAVFAAFDARSAGKREPAEPLATIDREAKIAAVHRSLRRRDGGVAYDWDDDDASLDRPLWPIATAAASLLLSADQRIVKECASETCDWLFIDRSRNRSRRWCDMNDCGNREKARRFYARQRSRQ